MRFLIVIIVLSVTANLLSEEIQPDDNLNIELTYTADWWHNTQGGLEEGDAWLDNLDLIIDWSLDDNHAIHFHTLANNNKTFSDLVGDIQVISNIDNDDMIRLFELWWQYTQESHSLRIGIQDLNADFDAIEPAGYFLNSSHGIGPDYSQSGMNGPSIFPFSAFGVMHQYQSDDWTLRWAIRDGSPAENDNPYNQSINFSLSDLLISSEVERNSDNLRLAAGIWYYTEKAEKLNNIGTDNNYGIYVLAQYHLALTDFGELNGWLRYGKANAQLNDVDYYLGAGLTLSQFSHSRHDDIVGVAIASVSASDAFQNYYENSESGETNIELTYLINVNDNFSIQPDIQYVINPGMDSEIENATVFGIRFVWTL